MKGSMNNIFRISALMVAFLAAGSADAIAPQNPRSSSSNNVSSARSTGRESKRTTMDTVSRATNARPSVTTARSTTPNVSSRATGTATASRNARSASTVSRNVTSAARSARSATPSGRSATVPVRQSGVSRAASSRATAVFDDVSKIGGGYAQCRESYATCMDQFCAKANETYRRCFCSERFMDFRDTEDALDQAKILLQRFEDNNLNAVDKTAAEVNAMYSATVGEAAIKNDTSGAAALLAEIGDLISGKKKKSDSSSGSTSLGVISLDFSSDIGDVWGGSSSVTSSIFGGDAGVDLGKLEGQELFNQVHKQCSEMAASSCQSAAVANMAKSAYGIMITQDCNAYEKGIDTKRQQVQNTVRQAEKILREARLEEYRAHNSQDVNACLDSVRSAMLSDSACGKNYARCMDYTGAYINPTNGEPVYSARLFELTNLIQLDSATSNNNGTYTDILEQTANKPFVSFLDERRVFAQSALDSCRDIADTVWTEFKRSALIEIAQAQDEKLEEVKSSCVDTMRECYDTQSNALKSFDDTTAEAAGALSVAAARAMCADKVTACAALYSNGDEGCEFDGNGKLENEGSCGLQQLLDYVETVDTVRVAEGCETALRNFTTELCTPSSGAQGYPWNCRNLTESDITNQILTRASLYCVDIKGDKYTQATYNDNIDDLSDTVAQTIKQLTENIMFDVATQLRDVCETGGGVWMDSTKKETYQEYDPTFYSNVFGTTNTTDIEGGGETGASAAKDKTTHGICVTNTVENACLAFNDAESGQNWATFNKATNQCIFTDDWYKNQCETMLGGTWESNTCSWKEE